MRFQHLVITVAWCAAIIAPGGIVPGGCKPSDEPARQGEGADASGSWFGHRDVGVPTPSGTVLVDPPPPVVDELNGGDVGASSVDDGGHEVPDVADEGEDTSVAALPDAHEESEHGDVALADEGPDESEPPSVVALPDELVARVRAPAPERAQEEARRFNRLGLHKHRRLELDTAMRDYLKALDAWPGHPFSNYNLACAYALTARPDDALRHLAILTVLDGETPRERLLSARLDPDFDVLFDDPRFRELTGYAPVWVSWSASVDRRTEAGRLSKALRGVSVPARPMPAAWSEEVSGPTLFVRAGDPVARRMAREVRAAVTLGDLGHDGAPTRELVEVERDDLDLRRAVVLVLPGRMPVPQPTPPAPPSGAEAGLGVAGGAGSETAGGADGSGDAHIVDEAAVGVRGEARAFADLVGARLVASDGGTAGRLELKPTGFFSWELVGAEGARTLRRGRYALRGDTLSLTYREDREVPGSDPAAPEVSFEENKESTHPIVVSAEGLTIDGVTYHMR